MGMFREKALVKLKSPEQLDEPLRVMPRMGGLALAAVLGTLLLFLIWSIVGRLPENGRGQGILVVPGSIVPIQAAASGQVAHWEIQVDDVVERGQVVGLLDQPLIEQQLRQAEAKLAEVKARNEVLDALEEQANGLEREAMASQRVSLDKRIEELERFIRETETFAERVREENQRTIALERENQESFRAAAAEINRQQQSRMEAYQRLRAEELASEDSLRNAVRQYEDGRLKLRELDLQRERLEHREVQLAESHLQAQNLIATRRDSLAKLQLQRRELENREVQLDRREQESALQDENEVRSLQREIERLAQQLEREREIRSAFRGRVLEITAAEGSMVNSGQRLVQLATDAAGEELVALAYFQDKVGKSLQAGMAVRVSPSTVDNRQYGNIRGRIESITEYPVTAEAVANYVGNSQVARQLTAGNHQVETMIALERDPAHQDRYLWTSRRGAEEVEVSAGTTADVWTTYERRAPITFVMPKLREWTGLSLSTKSEQGADE